MPSPSEYPIGPSDNDPRDGPRDDGQHRDDGVNPDPISPFDELLAELRSPNFGRIRLEAAVSLYVADLEDGFQEVDGEEHQSLETISDYLWDSAAEDYADLAERFHTIRSVVEKGIQEHATSDEVANTALQRICGIVLTDTASCLTSVALTNELGQYRDDVQHDYLKPFCRDVTNRVLRIANLGQNSAVPPERLDAEAVKMLGEVESNAQILLRAIARGEGLMSGSYASLIRRGVEQLGMLAPDISEEYQQILMEQLFGVYLDDYNEKLREIVSEQREQIGEALAMLRDALPPSARPPTP